MKRTFAAGIAALTVLVLAVVCSAQVRGEIAAAGERCLTVLIPSLYFYSMLGAFLIRSGGLRAIGERLGTRGMLLVTVLFSQVGGYPVGAQLLHEMRSRGELTAAQEQRLLCVCIGCGPGFLLGTVCRGMGLSLSLWVLLSVSVPNLVMFAFLPVRGEAAEPAPPVSLVESLNAAAGSAADAMLRITAMVLGFAGIMGIFEGMGIAGALTECRLSLLRAVLDVSCVTQATAAGASLPAAAALLAFGGFCVHLQAASICGSGFPWLRFWLSRLIAAGMAYGICRIGTQWIFREAVAVAVTRIQPALTTGSILPGLCLLLMAAMTLRRGEG